jgi:hydrogenase maturation protein HypF
MACSWLWEAEVEPPRPPADPERWEQVTELCRSGVAAPMTTSVGRLFDAVAALCGLRTTVNYEGQAAAELEGVAALGETAGYPMPELDARETIRAIVRDLNAGVPVDLVSARFHNALAEATAESCTGADTVVLSGGVFQNRLLLERTADRLERRGLRVLIPRRLPPNDGGISYGQAAVAAARAAA